MVCFDEFWNEAVILALWREVIDPEDSAFILNKKLWFDFPSHDLCKGSF